MTMEHIEYKIRVQPFDEQILAGIAKVLADTDTGLTGSEIDYLLRACNIPDPTPSMTKWKRLFNAFIEFQNTHQVGNHVVVFITKAMSPSSYTDDPATFTLRRDRLNRALALRGMTVGKDGKVHRTRVAKDLDEALTRANRFQSALMQRSVHDAIFKHCTAEILQKNYFHAVFEAMKSITEKIRELSGLSSDGADLVDDAFGMGKGKAPLVAINTLRTKTERGEQRGFVSLLKGLYGIVRNPLAHEPKIKWEMTEQDALDVMTVISLVHRKLDKARRRS